MASTAAANQSKDAKGKSRAESMLRDAIRTAKTDDLDQAIAMGNKNGVDAGLISEAEAKKEQVRKDTEESLREAIRSANAGFTTHSSAYVGQVIASAKGDNSKSIVSK